MYTITTVHLDFFRALHTTRVVAALTTRVVAALISENGEILLEAAANVIAEVLVPLAVLVIFVSVTVEGSGVREHVAPAALVVLDAERDELLDSAGAEAWAGTGVVDTMIPVMLDLVDVRAIVPIAVADAIADEDAPPPKTCVNGVGGVVPVVPEMAADVNTSVVASRVAEDEVLRIEAAVRRDRIRTFCSNSECRRYHFRGLRDANNCYACGA